LCFIRIYLLADLKRPTSKGRGGEGKGTKGQRREEERERKGKGGEVKKGEEMQGMKAEIPFHQFLPTPVDVDQT